MPYAAAWSSQNAASLASFYAENGSLTVNDGTPSVGRTAITATANGFMTAFPDMLVKMGNVSQDGSHVVFHWTWTGTNTSPGGTGNSVPIRGYEEWTIGADGLIAESNGHYDDAEYQRQLKFGAPPVRRRIDAWVAARFASGDSSRERQTPISIQRAILLPFGTLIGSGALSFGGGRGIRS